MSMITPFMVLENRFKQRRSGWLHRVMETTAQYVISQPVLDPDCLFIEPASNFTLNRRSEGQKKPLARVWRDGRVEFRLEDEKYASYTQRLIFERLTNKKLSLCPNSSKKTDASFLVIPRPDYLGNGIYKIDGVGQALNYWDARNKARELGVPVSGYAIVEPPYALSDVKSAEPIKTRKWDPEKRKEYLRMRREMKKQINLRAHIGALKLDRPPTKAMPWTAWREARHEWNKRALTELSPEENEFYKVLAQGSLSMVAFYARAAVAATPEHLIDAMNRMIKADSETLRLKTGAVVYTLETVSAPSPDDQNLVVQSSDSLRAVPPES